MAGRLTLAEQAVDCFGVENQIRKAVEEKLESAATLLKLLDTSGGGFSEENIRKAIEEIADDEICTDQLKTIFDKNAIAKIKNQKEVRLFDTICRSRSERNAGGLADLSSGKASGI